MKVILLTILVVYAATQSCEMSLDERVDCGFFGIDQAKC